MYTYKVMLKPNNKQLTKIRQTANKCIEAHNIVLSYLMTFIDSKEKIPSVFEVRRWFTTVKKAKDEEVIAKRILLTHKEQRTNHLDVLFYDVSNDALKQAVKDTYTSFVNWFRKLTKIPVVKRYSDYKKSFYVDPYKIAFTDKHVKLEKIANSTKQNRCVLNLVRLSERNRIPINVKYYNPRVIIEGDRTFIVVSVDDEFAPKKFKAKLGNDILGIDVNIHSIDLSDGTSYKSPLKSKRVRKIIKKGKRLQRKCSKKLLVSPKDKNNKLIKSNKFKLLNKIVQKYRRKLVNIYVDYHYKIINEILAKPPKEIHIEDLSIKNMKKDKRLSHSIHISSWGKFIRKLEEKCQRAGIKLLKIDRFFPSSKTCNRCGYINDNLTLKDRIFICPKCGYIEKRDYNAAKNIKDYKLIN